jgi:MYXO-CTERM domain-containing protein
VACTAGATESTERCNGTDDDCDGTVDDGTDLCAAGSTCTQGACTPVGGLDAGTPGDGGNITGGCGCTALAGGPAAWWALAGLALLGARRRKPVSRGAPRSRP